MYLAEILMYQLYGQFAEPGECVCALWARTKTMYIFGSPVPTRSLQVSFDLIFESDNTHPTCSRVRAVAQMKCIRWINTFSFMNSTHTHTHTHKTHTHTNTKRCSTTNSTFRDHTQLLRCYQSGQATAGQSATSTNTKTRHTHTNTHAQKLRRYCSLFFFWLSV